MGKDKKKYAKILGRLDSATQTVTLVWNGGDGGYGLCEGGDRLCYECNKFRGVADPVCCQTLQSHQWESFKLYMPKNKAMLTQQIDEATRPWKDRKVLVDIRLDGDSPPSPVSRPFERKYIVTVRVTASMKLLPLVVKDPNLPPKHEKHGVGFCSCFISLEDVISTAKSHREGRSSFLSYLTILTMNYRREVTSKGAFRDGERVFGHL